MEYERKEKRSKDGNSRWKKKISRRESKIKMIMWCGRERGKQREDRRQRRKREDKNVKKV